MGHELMKSFWPAGCRAAVSLTYDDALPVHIEHVAGKHEAVGSRATFFTDIRDTFMERHEDWKKVASRGHELGNHSIFHPCRKKDSMQWLADSFDLTKYDAVRFARELEVANFILKLTDGRDLRSYGNNCCNTTIGPTGQEESMQPVLKKFFGAARGSLNSQIILPEQGYNLHELGHFNGDGASFSDLKSLMEQTIDLGGWIILMFHGVGKGTHGGYIEKQEHDDLLDWLGTNSEIIWSRPLIEVAQHLSKFEAGVKG